jgi:hypothetical protein
MKHAHPSVPQDLRESMSRTVAYALDFVLDTLDFSPDETVLPQNEHELRKQDTADPIPSEIYAVLLWNDEKHSFNEVIHHVKDSTGCTIEEATRIANCIDQEVRTFCILVGISTSPNIKTGSRSHRAVIDYPALTSHISSDRAD